MTEQERQQTVEHESSHAAMALCVGVPVDRVEVFDRLRGRALGFAQFPFPEDMDADVARGFAAAILAGPLLDDAKPTPSWPLNENGGIDEQLLTAFTKRAGIDSAEDYANLVNEVQELSRTTRFRYIYGALTAMLEVEPAVLEAQDIRRAKELAWGPTAAEEEEEPRPEVDISGFLYEKGARQPVMMAPGNGLTWRYAT